MWAFTVATIILLLAVLLGLFNVAAATRLMDTQAAFLLMEETLIQAAVVRGFPAA